MEASSGFEGQTQHRPVKQGDAYRVGGNQRLGWAEGQATGRRLNGES